MMPVPVPVPEPKLREPHHAPRARHTDGRIVFTESELELNPQERLCCPSCVGVPGSRARYLGASARGADRAILADNRIGGDAEA